jgi:hypothetical protein
MLIGTGWTAYLGMSAQLQSVAMLLGAGLVTAWCFGREFTDRTLGGLFALPTSRPTIAAAKTAVTLVWSALVCLTNITVTCVLAPLAGLTVPSAAVFFNPSLKAVAVGLCAALLATPLAFIASAGRGYLPAIVALILIVVITQILSVLGVGGDINRDAKLRQPRRSEADGGVRRHHKHGSLLDSGAPRPSRDRSGPSPARRHPHRPPGAADRRHQRAGRPAVSAAARRPGPARPHRRPGQRGAIRGAKWGHLGWL